MAHKGIELLIRGRVQGVGYRYSAREQARRLGLRGWVRNTESGDVELQAFGEEETLRRLIEWCRNGPPGARVATVQQHWIEITDGANEAEQTFEIRH